jgi:hypothetical protein
LKIVFISSYKKKMLILILILSLWISMFFISDYFYNNSLVLNVIINRYISFSHPLAFELDNIYINENYDTGPEGIAVETSGFFKKPRELKFKSYESAEGKFSFKYPSSFILSLKEFPGSDILYHVGFHSKDNVSQGFVQVWNMPYSIEEFLTSSKENSLQTYKYFTSKPVLIDNIPGYHWDYAVLSDDGKYHKGNEVFFKKDSLMYRLSYFTPENLWNNSQSRIFWSMVKSFKTY